MSWLKRLTLPLIVSFLATGACVSQTIELVNNQPFSIRLPVEVRNFPLPAGQWLAGDLPIQTDNSNIVLIAQVEAASHKELELHQAAAEPKARSLLLQASEIGVRMRRGQARLGELSWDILLKDVHKKTADSDSTDSHTYNFDSEFKPLAVSFGRTASGPVFDTWEAQTIKDGLRLTITLRCFHDGFLDISSRLTNETAERTNNIYAAVICRWEQTAPTARSMCYDNHIAALGPNARSSFREGEGRHLAIQRG